MIDVHPASILVVDDDPGVVRFIARALERDGYQRVKTTSEPARAMELCRSLSVDLMILDLHMPGVTGYDILEQIKVEPYEIEPIPVLVLTGEIGREARMKALNLGARDYILKPFDIEVLARIRNLLERRFLAKKLYRHKLRLEEEVRERTADLKNAQVETVRRLGQAAEYRDDDTGEHVVRIEQYSKQMALALGKTEREAFRIGLAAKLHDIGKLGIPDAILLKPGKLTPEEFEVVKTHTVIGAKILAGAESRLLQLAEVIALNHHERWDGSGYPNGLVAEDIPEVARMVAVVDVFDALTSKRPYKEPWPVEKALKLLIDSRGTHFDPAMVDVFMQQVDEFLKIREQVSEKRPYQAN